jgi:hypothetical protein
MQVCKLLSHALSSSQDIACFVENNVLPQEYSRSLLVRWAREVQDRLHCGAYETLSGYYAQHWIVNAKWGWLT